MSRPPDGLGERLRALPDFDPPAAGWIRLSAALHAPRRRAWLPLSLAAGGAMLGLMLLLRPSLLPPERELVEVAAAAAPGAEVPLAGEADVALLLAAHSDDRDLLFAALNSLPSADGAVSASWDQGTPRIEPGPEVGAESEEDWI